MTWRGVALAVSLLALAFVLVAAVLSSDGPRELQPLTPQTAPQQPVIAEVDDDTP